MRDGRAVYIGAERVDDVTSHPAFREGAQTIAGALRSQGRSGQARSVLLRGGRRALSACTGCAAATATISRAACARCKAIADATYGFIGRSPDQVVGPDHRAGDERRRCSTDCTPGFGQNLLRYYEHARKQRPLSQLCGDAGERPQERRAVSRASSATIPISRWSPRTTSGVTVSGMKMLATSAVYADEILIGNLTPIDDKLKSEAITAALPLNAPGVSLWSRQPYALAVAPRGRLSAVVPVRRDRQRAGVRPGEDPVGAGVSAQRRRDVAAHLHRDAGELLPEPPVQHPLLVEDGPDRRAWRAASARPTAPTRSRRCARLLGRLASLEALIGGLVHGQIEAWEAWPEGYATPNRRIMYAALNWCQEHHTEIVDTLRTLLGGYPLVMPASDRRDDGRGAARPLRALVEDAVDRGGRAPQALQARLGHRRLGIRRPPHAVREVLRRKLDRGAQPERPRGAVGALPRHGRPAARRHRDARIQRTSEP